MVSSGPLYLSTWESVTGPIWKVTPLLRPLVPSRPASPSRRLDCPSLMAGVRTLGWVDLGGGVGWWVVMTGGVGGLGRGSSLSAGTPSLSPASWTGNVRPSGYGQWLWQLPTRLCVHSSQSQTKTQPQPLVQSSYGFQPHANQSFIINHNPVRK